MLVALLILTKCFRTGENSSLAVVRRLIRLCAFCIFVCRVRVCFIGVNSPFSIKKVSFLHYGRYSSACERLKIRPLRIDIVYALFNDTIIAYYRKIIIKLDCNNL